MALKIDVQKTKDGIVLKLSGELTRTEASLLVESIRAQLIGNVRSIILDLSEVSSIDSAGLGALVSAYTSVLNLRGSIRLIGLQSRSRDLLHRTNLSTVLEEESRDSGSSSSTRVKATVLVAAILVIAVLVYWKLQS